MFALGALVACLASLPRSSCFTCSVWTPSHSFHSLQKLLVVVVFLVVLGFLLVFWFLLGLVWFLRFAFASLHAFVPFTDWCTAHRQQSREQKNRRWGIKKTPISLKATHWMVWCQVTSPHPLLSWSCLPLNRCKRAAGNVLTRHLGMSCAAHRRTIESAKGFHGQFTVISMWHTRMPTTVHWQALLDLKASAALPNTSYEPNFFFARVTAVCALCTSQWRNEGMQRSKGLTGKPDQTKQKPKHQQKNQHNHKKPLQRVKRVRRRSHRTGETWATRQAS